MDTNVLYYGDNLDVMRRYVGDNTVDLVYLDPPFKSNQNYNVLFEEQDGSRSASQIKAFGDTWEWNLEAAKAYKETVELGGSVSQAMQAFRTFLGENDMLAYLSMMAPRLVELRRVLKDSGAIYLHCDPTSSHYLKMLMDAVFKAGNFRNEITWRYKKYQKAEMTYFTRNCDRILFYVASPKADAKFEPQFIKLDTPKRFLKRAWDKETSRIVNAKGEDGHVQYIEVDREKIDDVWELTYLMPAARERLGYPTQKPETLLERIINASSREGDLVLDPFCGCGTAVAVAQRLKRQWIGIDITHLAITLIKHRLHDAYGEGAKYKVVGEPVSLPDAQALAAEDPYGFQYWALGLAGARPAEQKKGADKGVDGRLYFHDDAEGQTKQVIFSVKAGKHIDVSMVRDLGHVVTREHAQIGVLISMEMPTKPMISEAAGAGFYHSPGWNTDYPILQIMTIEDFLGGKHVLMPPIGQVNVTFKKAPKAKTDNGESPKML